jgi:hypothetical protein
VEECQQFRRKEEKKKNEERIAKSHRKAQEEYLESRCNEVIEFQRRGHYD